MTEHKQPPPGTPDPDERLPGEEERDNGPPDHPVEGENDDVERVEENLENLHDKARPL